MPSRMRKILPFAFLFSFCTLIFVYSREQCEQFSCCNPPNINWIEQEWTEIPGVPIEIFSAFLDKRDFLFSDPGQNIRRPENSVSIRIIAHGLQAAYNKIEPLYCHVFDGIEWFPIGKAQYVRVYASTLHSDEFTSHFVFCFVPLEFWNSHDFVSAGVGTSECGKLVAIKFLKFEPKETSKITVGACVSPLYGRATPTQVAEFIEIHRLLGVEHFTFYLLEQRHSVSEAVRNLLKKYEEQSLVTLVRWPLKMQRSYFYFDQRSALNDCLFRTSGTVSHVAIMDLDEVMVPRSPGIETLPLLLFEIIANNSDNPISSFCFQHVYFEKNHSDPLATKSDLITQSKFWRTEHSFPAQKIRSKCIHAPKYLLATDIHFGQWFVNGVAEIILEEEIAILHHYRPHPMAVITTRPEIRFYNDYFLAKFGRALMERVSAMGTD